LDFKNTVTENNDFRFRPKTLFKFRLRFGFGRKRVHWFRSVFTQPSILSGSVNEYQLRLGRYKTGMGNAVWCPPCTWAPLWWAVPTNGRYNKCSTFTSWSKLSPRYTKIKNIMYAVKTLYCQFSRLTKSATVAGLSHRSCTVSCIGWLWQLNRCSTVGMVELWAKILQIMRNNFKDYADARPFLPIMRTFCAPFSSLYYT